LHAARARERWRATFQLFEALRLGHTTVIAQNHWVFFTSLDHAVRILVVVNQQDGNALLVRFKKCLRL
jgi:hypothetical protein